MQCYADFCFNLSSMPFRHCFLLNVEIAIVSIAVVVNVPNQKPEPSGCTRKLTSMLQTRVVIDFVSQYVAKVCDNRFRFNICRESV